MNHTSIDFTQFLPKYLSAESTKELLSELSQFPSNINSRFYTDKLQNENTIFQGDGLNNLPQIVLPEPRIDNKPGIVISNTCDIDPSNKRPISSNMAYAPIIKFSAYQNLINKYYNDNSKAEQHLTNVKEQKITQLLYLPEISKLGYDGIVLLDSILSLPISKYDKTELNSNKLFTLSDYGFYIFLYKLSVHFMRIQEKVDRFQGIVK